MKHVERINNNVTKEELKKHLELIVSDSIKGKDESLLNSVIIDNVEHKLSLLDTHMLDFNEKELNNSAYKKQGYLTDFISGIFNDNCLDEEYNYKITQLENYIEVEVEFI